MPGPPVVAGIGASAGGVEALQTLFAALPERSGIAFVVVVHLSPEHESQLVPILARACTLPVVEVSGEMPLEADHVYVIAPGEALRITDTHIGSVPFDAPRGQRMPIDTFFGSLAAQHGDGFAVILSGGGEDGAAGVKAIKGGGGLVLVQEPAEAAFDMMPRATIATGMADLVLPVRELAQRLGELAATKRRVRECLGTAPEQSLGDADETALQGILVHLRMRTGHDFVPYKRATVLRRIARRMQINRCETLDAYSLHVRRHAEEAQALFDDLLITVTTFFRDAEAWQALAARVIPELFAGRPAERALRAWVPGCATGEEAYTLAILLIEEAERRELWPEVQIFASDLDEGALATARAGRYPASIAADVDAARLARFFVREDGHYRVGKALRDRVVFASHSLLRDPPFVRLDLISCRNLLIYLDRDAQRQAYGIFRYALDPEGYLFLGSAENAEPEHFEPLDKHRRLYRVRAGDTPPALPEQVAYGSHAYRVASRPSPRATGLVADREDVEALAPPSVLVDERFESVRLLQGAGRYLQPADGVPTRSLVDAVRPELRGALRVALRRAFERGEASLGAPVTVRLDGASRDVSLWVRPRTDSDPPTRALVVFVESDDSSRGGGGGGGSGRDGAGGEGGGTYPLHEELRLSETRLREAVEEHESTIELLRASNEELQSVNEEYRSTAEELETSKEELQSINEELNTVNSELKHKLEEVSRAHDDLGNLMAATDIGTLFLDRALTIQRFTPPLAELFNVESGDLGRPIADFTHHLDYTTLEADARAALARLEPLEREARHADGRSFSVRLGPYRTAEERVDGVVVTFVDVSARERAERAQRESEQRFRVLIETVAQTVWESDPAGHPTRADGSGSGPGWVALVHPDERARADAQWRAALVAERSIDAVYRLRGPDGAWRWTNVCATPVRDADGRVREWIGMNLDIDDRRRAERARDESEARLHAVLASLPAVVPFATDGEGRLSYVSPNLSEQTGIDPDDVLGTTLWAELVHPEDRAYSEAAWHDARERGAPYEMRHRLRAADGSHRWAITRARSVRGGESSAPEWFGAIADVDELTRVETTLRETDAHRNRFLGLLGHELRNPLAAIANGLQVLATLGEGEQAALRAADMPIGPLVTALDKQSRHMTRLIDDLLDLTRIGNGKVALRPQRLALSECIERATETLRPRLAPAGLELVVRLPDEPLELVADPDRLSQMLDNLLDNALKYSDPGGRIELGAVREGDELVITVRDGGIGIAPEALTTLFRPFTQIADPGDGGRGGLGLGLALVRSLAELHGGVIEAYSAGLGEGSEFRLRLPLRALAAELETILPIGPAAASVPLRQRRVLVVDDTADVADPFAALLRAIGQQVEVAYDGDAALAVAADFAPEVAFLDLGMPGMDGLELARRLRRRFAPEALVLIALTGYGQGQDFVATRMAGFDHHLLKPLRLDVARELLRTLEH